MSLDFSLYISDKEVFSRNITHNLNKMADAAGIYKVLWRPEELGFTHAKQCTEILTEGIVELIRHKTKYEEFNSPNGWGMYEHFVPFVIAVLTACHEFPDAVIEVSR